MSEEETSVKRLKLENEKLRKKITRLEKFAAFYSRVTDKIECFECHHCEDIYGPDDVLACSTCDRWFCRKCNIVEKCEGCKKYFCDEHVGTCYICGAVNCVDECGLVKCVDCDRLVCVDCQVVCENCGEPSCSLCPRKCNFCDPKPDVN